MGEFKVVLVPRASTAKGRHRDLPHAGLSRQRSADLIGRGQVASTAGRSLSLSGRPRGDARGRNRRQPRSSASFPARSRVSASVRRRRHLGDRQAGRGSGAPERRLERTVVWPSGWSRLPHLDVRGAGTARHRATTGRRHLRAHGGGQERDRLHGLEAGLPVPIRRQDLSRPGAGAPRPVSGHHRGADRSPSDR